jgi:hypothetical protein
MSEAKHDAPAWPSSAIDEAVSINCGEAIRIVLSRARVIATFQRPL